MTLTVVKSDNVQAVEELPLVLMNPLDLDVKDGLWIDFYVIFFLQVRSKFLLVFLHVTKDNLKVR